MSTAVQRQRAFYDETSPRYDVIHSHDTDEHGQAMAYLLGMIDFLGARSILDVGCGTGWALLKLRAHFPELSIMGVEPSAAQRAVAYAKGISETELVEGDAQKLSFDDGAFDVVCEFGALHHMPRPASAVAEMLRVARKAVFICDANCFGQGGPVARLAKQALHGAGLWPLAVWAKSGGKGYHVSEGDGVQFSYSVFSDLPQIRRRCSEVRLLSLTGSPSPNLYRSASHVGVLGILGDRK